MSDYDKNVMAKLLSNPEIKPKYEAMTEQEQAFYKKILVSSGVYAQFEREQAEQEYEQNKNLLKENWEGLKASAKKLFGR